MQYEALKDVFFKQKNNFIDVKYYHY